MLQFQSWVPKIPEQGNCDAIPEKRSKIKGCYPVRPSQSLLTRISGMLLRASRWSQTKDGFRAERDPRTGPPIVAFVGPLSIIIDLELLQR